MCGIAGQVFFRNKIIEKSSLKGMAAFMQERGPDYTGYWSKNNVGLVHTRLSIIDLDERSHQPMLSEDQQIVLSFNGEIYNFKAIRKELADLGCSFRTDSDTEILILGYRHWGIDGLLKRVTGMFAFALYDRAEKHFFLVRDFFGKKPLYYYHKDGELLFASDIRAIWNQKKAKLSLDYESLDYFLTELSSPQPKTIWKEVKQVPAAHYICFDLEKETTKTQQFWDIEPKIQKMSFQDALEETEARLKKAIYSRTIADVPLGCFLSGGVDSGLVVSLLAQQVDQPVSTYSIGLKHETLNELPDAKIVADRYSTNHHEIILETDVLDDLPQLVEYYGEPFGDSSMLPSFYVTKAISKSVRVALSGDGGDELFGGYKEYGMAFRADEYMKNYPNPTFRKFRTFLDKIFSRISDKKENMGAYATYLNWSGARRLYRQMGLGVDHKKLLKEGTPLYEQHFGAQYLEELWKKYRQDSFAGSVMTASLKTRLLNDYLVKVDRASMLNSLEVRSPFLDKDLAEWAFSIPMEHKFKGFDNKYLLKKLAEKHIDKNIMSRPKRGFGIPIRQWFRGKLKDWVKSILLDDSFTNRGLFKKEEVEQLLERHQQGANEDSRIWALICLELWFQRFVD